MGGFEDQQRTSAAPTSSTKPASKAPLPKPPPATDGSARISAASAALLDAQHWFDKGTAAASSAHPIDWRTVCANGLRSLDEARAVLAREDRMPRPLVERIDETRRAMDLYFTKMTPRIPASEAAGYRVVVAALHDRDRMIRFAFDLPWEPTSGPHLAATKADDVYTAGALNASLDLIAIEARSTLDRVRSMRDPNEYRPLISSTLGSLRERLAFASSSLDTYRGKDKYSVFSAKIQQATRPIDGLHRFVEARQNNQQMLGQFAAVTTHANRLRTLAKLSLIGQLEGATTGDEDASARAELAEINAARAKLTSAFTSLNTRITAAADQFYELAKLDDPPDDTSLLSDLVQGLVIALIGNVVGPAVSQLVTRLVGTKTTKVLEVTEKLVKHPQNAQRTVKETILKGGEVSNRLSEGGQSFVGGSATDASQAWAGTAATAATAANSDKREQNKAALFFKKSMVLGADGSRAMIEKNVAERQHAGDISATEIYGMASGIERDAQNAFTRALTGGARDFALLLAHQSLGAEAKPNAKPKEKQVTKIGKDYQFGPPGWTDGGRAKAQGIARIRIELTDSGYSVDRYELVGLNRELAKLVYDGAAGKLGGLGVPTEIELSSDRSNHKELLVVDEEKKVRFSSAWKLFRVPAVTATEFASSLVTPEKAWQKLRDITIPNTFTIKTDDQ